MLDVGRAGTAGERRGGVVTRPGVLIVITGGTIDKTYFDELDGYKYDRSVIGKIVEKARITGPSRLVELTLKDSLDLTDEDRENIRATVASAPETNIVITHGTDTMVETALYLARAAFDKTIVLAGAFMPARFADSDGPFNVGMAFGAAQTAPAGVYIAMNGGIFTAGNALKDRARATFMTTDGAALSEEERHSVS
jgi:L-asparaginase